MKKERIFVPKPKSAFLLVRCNNCSNEQIIFSSSSKDIFCKICENLLANKTGGNAKIHGKILNRLD